MGFLILDSISSLVICFFIEKAAFDIFKDAIDKMVDKACDDIVEHDLKECALQQDGVLGVDMLKTRTFAIKFMWILRFVRMVHEHCQKLIQLLKMCMTQ